MELAAEGTKLQDKEEIIKELTTLFHRHREQLSALRSQIKVIQGDFENSEAQLKDTQARLQQSESELTTARQEVSKYCFNFGGKNCSK